MPSPFPGMNPWLEQPDVWHDFHQRFVSRLGDSIAKVVRPSYIAKIDENVYVLGDASSAAKMPKSAYAANSQAKVAVAAILSRFAGQEPGEPTYVNTCYSIIAEEHGISVAAVYRLSEDGKVIDAIEGSSGLSPMDASPEHRKREVTYAHSWFHNVIDDMLR